MKDLAEIEKALEEEKIARERAEKSLQEKCRELEQLRARIEQIEESKVTPGVQWQSALVRLSSLISNIDLAILVEDENRKVVLINQKFCDLFHIPVTPDQLIGTDCSQAAEQAKELFKDPDFFIQRIEEVLQHQQKTLSDKLEMKDGTLLKRDFIPVQHDNLYLGHLWTYEDVTDLSSTSRTIESLSRFPKESPSPILRCTAEGQILYANAAAKPIVSALTTHLYNSEHKKSYEQISNGIKEAYRSQSIQKKEIDIANRIFDLTIVPVIKEDYINIYGTDITEIKTAERKIKLLNELMDQMDEFIQILDKEGNFFFINKPSAKRFGKTVEELTGTNIKALLSQFYNKMTWEEQFDFFKSEGTYSLESTHTRPDGTVYPLEASIKYTENNGKEFIITFSKDISNRKQAEKELEHQKTFYEDILNNIPSDIAVYNPHNQYLFVNPAAIANQDIRKWIIGKTDFDYCAYRSKDTKIALQRKMMLDDVVRNKRPLEWEDVIKTSDGSLSYHLRRSQPVMDENGNVKIIIGYGLNITEMKKVQEQLEKSEELHRLVIYATNDGIWDWDIETGHVFFSERWKRMLGYKEEELEAHVDTWEKVLHPDDFPIAVKILQDHFDKHVPFTYTLRFLHKDGSLKWIMCRGFAIRHSNGKPYRMLGSCTDITETKLSEARLKESEKKFHAIFNHSHDAKFIIDTESNTIIDCNDRAVELFEAESKSDMINKLASQLRKHPLTKFEYNKIEKELHLKGYWSQEVLYGTLKGNAFWGNIVAKTITINGQELSIARISDITETKHNEQELIKAKQDAEDSKKAKEIFLANMSHEIRTPMNGILGMSELLSKTTLSSVQQNYLRLIKNSADNLLIIINDILDIAKIESGKLTFEKIPFDVCDVIKNAVQSLYYKAEEKGIALNMHPIELPHAVVIGDPYRLTQIWINLINNAIKFTENGYVEISGRVPRETEDEITFEFSVRDTGIGIPSEKLDSIFEGFTQASDETTRKFGGTGLGLTICKDLVKMHGGNIWVESSLGNGSRFVFSLTYKKGILKEKTKKTENITGTPNLKKITILLAEDNEVNQFLAKTILTDWGAEVDIAHNGKEALTLFESNTYDLILMDIQMPLMGGLEATKIIRSNQDKQKAMVPIIALTANALVGDAEKYIEAGMNDYLSKPFEREKLYATITDNINPLLHPVQLPSAQVIEQESLSSAEDLPDYAYLENNFGNQDFLLEIMTIFIETTPTMSEDLVRALKEKNYEQVQATAHKLKSSIDSFRIKSLKPLVREIEHNAAKQIALDALPSLIETLNQRLNTVNDNIKEQIKKYKA